MEGVTSDFFHYWGGEDDFFNFFRANMAILAHRSKMAIGSFDKVDFHVLNILGVKKLVFCTFQSCFGTVYEDCKIFLPIRPTFWWIFSS